jgi:hypothetical protein
MMIRRMRKMLVSTPGEDKNAPSAEVEDDEPLYW